MTFAPICVPCRREMRCRKNDFMFFDYGMAAIWAGDKYGCERCGAEIVIGFSTQPSRPNEPHWSELVIEATKGGVKLER